VYGNSWQDEEPEHLEPGSIFVCHKSITPDTQMFETISAKEYIKRSKFKDVTILCGDIHSRFEFYNKANNCTIINTGPLIRRSINELTSHKPCFLVFKNDKAEYHELEYTKDNYSEEHLRLAKEQDQAKLDLKEFIDKIHGTAYLGIDFKGRLMGILSELELPVKQQIEKRL